MPPPAEHWPVAGRFQGAGPERSAASSGQPHPPWLQLKAVNEELKGSFSARDVQKHVKRSVKSVGVDWDHNCWGITKEHWNNHLLVLIEASTRQESPYVQNCDIPF